MNQSGRVGTSRDYSRTQASLMLNDLAELLTQISRIGNSDLGKSSLPDYHNRFEAVNLLVREGRDSLNDAREFLSRAEDALIVARARIVEEEQLRQVA